MTDTDDERERERRLADNRAALARAREEIRRIDETLQASYKVRREVVPKLRRAGRIR